MPDLDHSVLFVEQASRSHIDRAFMHGIFQRDHPGPADENTVNAFADAILTLDDSMPTGTYVDRCSKLPLQSSIFSL